MICDSDGLLRMIPDPLEALNAANYRDVEYITNAQCATYCLFNNSLECTVDFPKLVVFELDK